VNLKKTLRALGAVILDEADRNPEFAARILDALGESGGGTRDTARTGKARERPPAVTDPVAVIAEQGEESLRQALGGLSLDQLLDIVAEFGMDPSKLVMKWKKPERVIDHIVENARRRSVKGNAFRA
jgi:hypothetical protein